MTELTRDHMIKIFKKYTLPAIATIFTLTLVSVKAQCQVCTIAVIGGVGLARWLKIDDSITGLWVGGLLVSVSIWTVNWLKDKKWTFIFMDYLIPVLYYASVIIPLYYYKIVGHPNNIMWGFDKLILGTVIGSIFFYAMHLRYLEIKKNNNNHAQFSYQKVVLPVATLVVLSAIMYFITKI
jgi:hypothetical protein